MNSEDKIAEEQVKARANQALSPEDNEVVAKLKKYGTYILVTCLVIVALVIYNNNKSESDSDELTESGIALERIMTYFEKGDFAKALDGDPSLLIDGKAIMGLKEIASKYDGTPPAQLAAFYAGKIELGAKNIEQAKSLFNKAELSKSQEVKLGAVSMLALVEENIGNYKSAASYYEKAFELTQQKDIQTRMKLFSAICFEKAGSNKKAKNAYNKVITMNFDNAFSEFVGLAQQGLIRLGTNFD